MQSPQARQRKLERKRRKREEKRRSLYLTSLPEGPVALRGPKMSETLVDYAQPLIEQLPDGYGHEELQAALLFASVVWNAVVAQEGNIAEVLALLTEEVAGQLHIPPPEASAMIEALAERKLEHFGADPRVVVAVKVFREGDQLRILAASAL